MTEPVEVTCSCCGGRGVMAITGEYFVTLQRLREIGGERTGAELSRDMGVKATAMNNRLSALYRMGLVTCRPFGRKKFYTAKVAS